MCPPPGWWGERGAGLRRVRGAPVRGGRNVATRGVERRGPADAGPWCQCSWMDNGQTLADHRWSRCDVHEARQTGAVEYRLGRVEGIHARVSRPVHSGTAYVR